MGKDNPNVPTMDFADVLGASIDQHYGTAEAFAAACRAGGATVVGSTVSRWLRRVGLPSARKIDELSPWILDARGKPIPASKLIALAYPNLAPDRDVRVIHIDRPMHPLARELNDLLSDDSSMPSTARGTLASLADALMAPYRRYLRRRKAA